MGTTVISKGRRTAPYTAIATSSMSPSAFTEAPVMRAVTSFTMGPRVSTTANYRSPGPDNTGEKTVAPPVTTVGLSTLSSADPGPSTMGPGPPEGRVAARTEGEVIPTLVVGPFDLSRA